MSKNMKITGKTARRAAITAAAGAAAYFITGGAICESILSRFAVNKEPEETLKNPENMHKYLNDRLYREADDWFTSNNPAIINLENGKNEMLHAHIIPAKAATHKWAVVVHGYTSRPRNMARQGKHFSDMGYNVLLPYMRAHRASEQRHCSMGYFEKYDVISWINYIVSTDQDAEIVLLGTSMGGATVMLVSGEALPQNVKCIVADCGYTSCWEEYRTQIKNVLHLPAFPFLNAANSYSRLVLGWNFKKCSPLESVKRSITPTLFIHGEEDKFVPYSMMGELFDACAAPKDMLSVPGAEHDMSCAMHPELYWPKIEAFIAEYIK